MNLRGVFLKAVRLFAVAAGLVAPMGHAHLMPAGEGTVRLVGDSAYVVVAYPASLMGVADDNQDGLISVAEIDRHRAVIGAQVSERLQLQSGDKPGRLVFEDLLLSHAAELEGRGADSIIVARRYQWPEPVQSVSVRASIFDPGRAESAFLLRAIKGGQNESALLTPERTEASLFAGSWEAFTRSLVLGGTHILIGADHLLFLLTVLVAGAGWRYWASVVTSFTAAHSITLALAVLGIVRAPAHLIEPLIAASIVLLALDNILRGPGHPAQRVALTFGCGLLHGLGIASVLTELPISTDGLALTLAGFNLGVELGQLAFVAVALGVLAVLNKLAPRDWQRTLVTSGSAVAALVGSFWLVQRLWT